MKTKARLYYLDNLKVFLIFLVVLVHAGVVYESSGLMAPYWIVDDPSTSDLPGLVNLMLDIFVMYTFFFISGYLAPASLENKGSWHFLKARFRRIVVPWVAALFTLIPLFNMMFLYSRGLPQEGWARYFHFSNGTISMSWLWFLPVLFLFNVLYVLLRKLNLPTARLPIGLAVAALFVASVGYCELLSAFDLIYWTKTPLIDFQNERLLPYFLVFLLGALCYRKGILEDGRRNMKLYITICATAWIPMNIYLIVLLNFFLRPGKYILSAHADGLALWVSLYLSMLSLLYCMVATFKYYCRRQRRLRQVQSRLSYNVYIIHIVVMGPIAIALLHTDLPALVKYPLLALATYVGSNLAAWAYAKGRERLSSGRRAKIVCATEMH